MSDSTDERTVRLEGYEDRTALAMVFLAVAYLAIFAVQVLVFPMSQPWDSILFWVGNAIWLTFVLDLAFRTYLAPRRWSYLARHPIDVLAALVPAFRSLRVLRVITAGQWLVRRGSRLAVGRTASAILLAVSFLTFMAALAVYDAERGAVGANIDSFGNALWWAVVTMTTVGYGDTFPVTVVGRLVAVGVMIVGISLIGLVSATLASGFLARIQGQSESDTALILKKLEAMEAQLSALSATTTQSNSTDDPGAPPDTEPSTSRTVEGRPMKLRIAETSNES